MRIIIEFKSNLKINQKISFYFISMAKSIDKWRKCTFIYPKKTKNKNVPLFEADIG